jgi:antirestriction protein
MDLQSALNVVFGIAATTLGWFARELWAAVNGLKADVAKLREDIPRNYVAKDDYREDIRDLKGMLEKIFDRLENKMDK